MAQSESTRAQFHPRPGSVSGPEAALLALFFLSGAAALVYEVVWTRELTYVFGGSAFAIATVLAAFMAGLALGSATFGRMIDRRGNPLVVYAVLEAGIGIFALVLPSLFTLMDPLYAGLYRNLDAGVHTLGLVRFTLSFLVLLVPTTLMGGTLPVLGRLLIRGTVGLGFRAGLLYGVNTLGAVVGVAAGGFVLLPALGLWKTTLAAVAVNLVIAGLALVLARRAPGSTQTRHALNTPATGPAPSPEPQDTPPGLRRVVLVVYAASGFAALAYEVAWTKTLSMILGTTTYAFSAMLVTFLLGLAVGSALFARVADRARRPAAVLALVQCGIPLLALAALPLMGTLPQRFVDAFPVLDGSWFKLDLYRVLLAGSVMFLPTVLMGATFPLVSRVYLGRDTVGASLGSLYAANTVGAILGSFVTGFVLVPFLGRQASVLVACGVNLAAVLLLLPAVRWREAGPALRLAMAGLLVAAIPAFVWGQRPWDARVLASGAYVYAETYARAPSIRDALAGDHLVYYDEGAEGTVSVWQREYQTTLRINGKVDASSHGDRVTQKLLAHLPALYHRDPMAGGLVIGLGSGVSAGALLAYPIDRVETVELMPGMVEAAHRFDAYNRRPLDDPRHHLIVGDGRNHLRLTDRRYDVIVSEPSNPWIAGIGSLFTREFFRLACDRLAPGGVLSQWVQIYDFNPDDLRAIFATVTEVFPHVHAWMASPGDLILIASEDPLELDPDALTRALDGVPGEDLASVEILPVEQLLSCFITDETGLAAYAGNAARVTDDNLYLETAVPRHMVDGSPRVRLSALEALQRPASRLLAGRGTAGLDAQVDPYRTARMLAYAAHYEGSLPPGETEAQAVAAAHRIAPRELLARKLYGAQRLRDGIRNLQNGDPQTAAAILGAVAADGLRDQQATACLYLGSLALEAGDLEDANRRWLRCLSLEPRYPEAYVYLGDIAVKAGRLDEGQDLLAKATDLVPTHTAAWVRRARIHALRGEWTEAQACLEPARRGDPQSLELAMVEGAVAIETGRPKRAVERFQTVLAAEPRKAEAVYNLAVAYEGVDDFAEAATTWKRYLELRPGNAEAQQSLAWLLATRLDAPGEAETLARASMGVRPSAGGFDALAESLYRQGKQREAVEAAKRALSLEDRPYYREQLARFQGGADR